MSAVLSTPPARKTVLAACPHDCPDTCSMLVTVEGDRVVSVKGNPDHPFTDGRLCVKVNHYEERVHHADRVLYPLKRSGPKGSGQFTRITWAAAMDEIASRWKLLIQQHGPTAILPYSYLGTEGILNGMNVGDPFFNKLGATITERTFCDSGACTGYMMTVGPTPGTDPESFVHSRYIILWACNTISTNTHHWPIIAEAQKRGAKVVVVDPVRTRTARQADWHIAIKPGTDGALAMAMMNVIIGEGSGRQGVRRELHRRLRRAGRARAAVSAGEGGCDHRHPRRRHPQARARIRHDAPVRDPHRRGGRAARRRRSDGARADLPARTGGRLARRRRRHPAASHLGVPGEMGEPDAPGLDQARHACAESMEAGRRARPESSRSIHRSSRCSSTTPTRWWSHPSRRRCCAGWPAKICSLW